MNNPAQTRALTPQNSVVIRMADRYGVDRDKLLVTLKATAFKGEVTNEQLMALLVVADQHRLNPWTKEIYAFVGQGGAVIPIVGVDGWSRILNENEQFDGMDFEEGPLDDKELPTYIECIIHRKDRTHPVRVKEYMVEAKRKTAPWDSHPRRMLRHKAMIQCARIAFGFGGIYDEDEGERIAEATVREATKVDPRGDLSAVDLNAVNEHVGAITDILNADQDEKEIARMLREHISQHLNPFPELWIAVNDALVKRGVISKNKLRAYISLNLEARQTDPKDLK